MCKQKHGFPKEDQNLSHACRVFRIAQEDRPRSNPKDHWIAST